MAYRMAYLMAYSAYTHAPQAPAAGGTGKRPWRDFRRNFRRDFRRDFRWLWELEGRG